MKRFNSVEKFLSRDQLWHLEIGMLRKILKGSGLEETIKWGLPCYSFNKSNVLILQPFKTKLAVMFFRGVSIKDKKGLLVANGPNSQSARRFEIQSISEITKYKAEILKFIQQAIKISNSESSPKKVVSDLPIPAEILTAFKADKRLKSSFEKLTPGRRRAYILFISSAKQSSTRNSRIQKCRKKILKGLGLHD